MSSGDSRSRTHTPAVPLARLQEYAGKVNSNDYDAEAASEDEDYKLRLNVSEKSLRDQVKRHEIAIEKLRATDPKISIDVPSGDPAQRLQQLRVITAAYKVLTPAEPLLPSRDSPLPALLALRSTMNLVDQIKLSVTQTEKRIAEAQAKLRQEEINVEAARSIVDALGRKIDSLQVIETQNSLKADKEKAEAFLQEQKQRKLHHVKALRKLVRALNQFVDEHLAVMLAAEDLSEPVAGHSVGATEEKLKEGLDRNGKAKIHNAGSITDDIMRKRRNSQMSGSEIEQYVTTRSKKEATVLEFRSLMEDLLNATAIDENSDPYIEIPKESTGVEFLVRAKVAQFHPNDATKLRLTSFGMGD